MCILMTFRSSRTEAPDLASLMKTTDEIIESLVCPPPPTEASLNEEMISRMIVPAPNWNKVNSNIESDRMHCYRGKERHS